MLAVTCATGFRHDSIPDAIAAVQAPAAQDGFAVDTTEDPGVFADSTLSAYSADIFLLTTGQILDSDQQRSFERYMASGNGFVGVVKGQVKESPLKVRADGLSQVGIESSPRVGNRTSCRKPAPSTGPSTNSAR